MSIWNQKCEKIKQIWQNTWIGAENLYRFIQGSYEIIQRTMCWVCVAANVRLNFSKFERRLELLFLWWWLLPSFSKGQAGQWKLSTNVRAASWRRSTNRYELLGSFSIRSHLQQALAILASLKTMETNRIIPFWNDSIEFNEVNIASVIVTLIQRWRLRLV